MEDQTLSQLANVLITAFEKDPPASYERKITVNPVVSKFASWYEKFRNAMDYREEEVILRAAIERILKRRILFEFEKKGKKIAEPLLRELVWARYFPNESLPEALIEKVEEKIDLYLRLRQHLLSEKKLSEGTIEEWINHLTSSDIENLLYPRNQKDVMSNFIFQTLRSHVQILDDSEQTRDVQVFIAVRRAFAKDDLAFLRYHLFAQYFGELTAESFDKISKSFHTGFSEIQHQLSYPLKDKVFSYVKRRAAIFFILEDVLVSHKKNFRELIKNPDEFQKVIFAACQARYDSISSKVQRAIIRSVIFILLTKAFFAYAVEGTFDRFFYGRVFWSSIFINTLIPPVLMIIVGLFIHPPSLDNSKRIFSYIQMVLSSPKPQIGNPLIAKKNPDKKGSILFTFFSLLWILAFFLTFGVVIFVLTKLQFNVSSQTVFLFFLAIVSFLSYRIAIIPRTFAVEDRQSLITPLVDFLFLPVIRVGRNLTEGIAQINILIFLFDFVIETPFKVLFAFFEQWFLFLHAKREDLG